MASEIICRSLKYQKSHIQFLTNRSESKKLIIYLHGLDGSASFARPLFDAFKNYKIVAIEQRGHANSQLKASRSIAKHLKDYRFVVNHFRALGYRVWLLGESMGGSYSVLFAYKYPELIEGVFAQSIPSKLVNVFKASRWEQFKVQFLTSISYLTNINFAYQTQINYELFSNNRALHRLARLADRNKNRQIRETLATWAANKRAWRYMAKKVPQKPVYYFQPGDDVVANLPKVRRIFAQKKPNLTLIWVPHARHILTYEKQFSIVVDKIKSVLD
ncbi:alpha/beta fold hydrolase [Mycoplasma sp. ATU-Cv-703]|uniref:alpha/beta fold hydrolase n=1 Tax=Mycoplasma sp. ATU-Cv-703 TaxID=2498595 RepID=UPI000FDD5185